MIKLAPIAAVVLLVAVGLAGGQLLKLLKFPAPFLLGPVVAVTLCNLLRLPIPVLPPHIDKIAQVIIGFCLGANITRNSIRELKAICLPAAAIVIWSLVITFVFSFFLIRTTPLSLATAVLSSSPGGVPEVVIMAMSVDADAATVTVMQIARLLAVVLFVPLFSKIPGRKSNLILSCAGDTQSAPEVLAPGPQVSDRWGQLRHLIKDLLNPGLLVAMIGSLAFNMLRIPAGFMIGAMVATGIASIGGLGFKPLPVQIRQGAYIIIGIMVGQFFTREVLAGMVDIYPVILLLTGLMLLSSVALAWAIARVTGWPLIVCLLSAAPGGLVAMTTLASDLDADPVKVSLLHLSRLVTVKLILPLVVLFI